ncbi:Transcription factor PAR2 [Capsicum annuum]|uniref:Transcription factor PAR2 n=1 Tax=Capsicum annuum TaxID=4072 RepID=A0A1U8H7M7_CAPAN|nr:transcription factor PAR1 [Capsicum annuum]KAF3664396.1 Transcription factor PAR2 [Capsicum annuum]PHT76890.1 Transcription factor PAR2 [Capsicum annuum]
MDITCNNEETTPILPTLSRKDKRMTQKVSKRQKRRRESGYIVNSNNEKNEVEEEGDDDEKAEVEEKILALQKIVPGGESLGVDMLFEETAGYILQLQCQVKALKVLASFVEGTEKAKMKLGG